MLKFCKPVFYFNKTNYSTEGEFAVICSLSWGSTTLFEKTDMREHMHVLLISDMSWSMMMCLLTSINHIHPSDSIWLFICDLSRRMSPERRFLWERPESASQSYYGEGQALNIHEPALAIGGEELTARLIFHIRVSPLDDNNASSITSN